MAASGKSNSSIAQIKTFGYFLAFFQSILLNFQAQLYKIIIFHLILNDE